MDNVIFRTNSENQDFKALVSELDKDLAIRDGDEHGFYHQFNGISQLHHVLIVYTKNVAVACGAIKKFDHESAEIKRMYVLPDYRNQGLATTILLELERWTKELGFSNCVLETGKRQPEAIALYHKNGYEQTANYPPYVGKENSVCFRKRLV